MDEPEEEEIYDGIADYGQPEEGVIDDDPNWSKGLTGESDEETSESKAARKKARHEQAIRESCIAAALEEKRKRKKERAERKKEKKKKKKKHHRHQEPIPDRIYANTHEGCTVALTNGKRFTVVDSTKVKGAYVTEYGEHSRDTMLKLKETARDGKDIIHETALRKEEDDLACIRKAALSEERIPLGELSVRIGLARMLGSRERAEFITKNDPRHHLITALPPFAAFQPECTDPVITKPSGDKTRPFPVSLLHVSVTDRTSAFKQTAISCPSLGGFETVSGAQTYRDAESDVVRRIRVQDAQDSTKKSLFTIRSSYSDITSLYWIQLSARDVSLMHLLITELVALSGVDAAACDKVLPPVTDYFSTAALNPPNGSMPWNLGEMCSSDHCGKPMHSVREQEFSGKNDQQDHTDRVLLVLHRAIQEILECSLPEKTKVFSGDREPRRPMRRSQFSDANLNRFLELRPQIRKVVRVDPEWGQVDARDLAAIHTHVTNYLRGYLDWRYFVLPDMVMGALAVAYETIHPAMNDGFVIRTIEDEHTRASRTVKRMCEDTHVACPVVHMLFKHYYLTGYEKYAAALLLWNFIGRKKVLVLEMMNRHEAEKNRLSEEEKKKFKRLPPLKYRPDIVPFDAVFDMYGRTKEGSADMTVVAPVEFIQHITSRINDVYKWNLFPQLFLNTIRPINTTVLHTPNDASEPTKRPGRAPKLDYVAFDKELAKDHRAKLKERSGTKRRHGEDDQDQVKVIDANDTEAMQMYVKAMYKGKVRVSYDHVPKECQNDLDASVRIFDESFTLVGPRSYERMGVGAYKAHWSARKAVKLVRAYMNVHKLLSTAHTTLNMMVFHTRDKRKEAPGLEKYMSSHGANIIFKLDTTSDLGRWFKENLEQDSAKLSKLAK